MDSSLIFRTDAFEKNSDLFAKINPIFALQLELIWDAFQLQLIETEKGEPNLAHQRYGITDYYHAQTGALKEAVEIANSDTFKNAEVIYYYGLGLGYIFDAAQPWLQADPQHHLVLLEDDFEVIYYFLHTERATRLLQDTQTTIFCFQDTDHDDERFRQLHSNFLNRKIDFLTLPYYGVRREKEL